MSNPFLFKEEFKVKYLRKDKRREGSDARKYQSSKDITEYSF